MKRSKKNFFALLFSFLLGFPLCFLGIPRVSAADTNLIQNPGVEESDTTTNLPLSWSSGSWGINTTTFQFTDGGYNNSTKALRTEIANYQDGDAKWYFNPVTIDATKEYIYSDYYQSNVTSNLFAEFIDASGNASYQSLISLPASTEWKNSNIQFQVPAGTVSLTIFHLINSNGFLITDNFSLTETNITPPSDPGNPPVDPGNTDGSVIAKFDTSNDGFDQGIVTSGALQLQNQINGDASTRKVVNSPILKGYDAIEFDINLNSNNILDGDAGAIFIDQGGQKMVALKSKVTNGLNGWQHVKIPFSEFTGLNSNDGIASIYFRFWNYTAGTYGLDNIVLTKGGSTPSDPTDPNNPPTDPTNPDGSIIAKFDATTDGFDQGTIVSGSLEIKNPVYGDASTKKLIGSPILKGYKNIEFDINLNGNNILTGDAGALFIDQGGQKMVALKGKVTNGLNGWQHVKIPFSEFTGLNTNDGITSLYFRFWNTTAGTYDLDNIILTTDSTTPPSDPGNPPVDPGNTDGSVIAKFDTTSDGFDQGTVTSGALQLQNQINGDASTRKVVNSPILKGYDAIEFDINLNGNSILDGDAGALFIDQGGQKMVALKSKVTNGLNGWQHVKIPFSEFTGLNSNDGIASIYFRFWNYTAGTYGLDNIVLTKGSSTPSDPTDPTNLAVSINGTVSNPSINLTWEGNDLSYIIYRDNIEIARTTEKTYIDTNVTPNSTYSYFIKSTNGSKTSNASNTAAITTPSIVLPPDNNVIPNNGLEQVSPDNSALPLGWLTDGWGTNTTTYEYLNTGHNSNHSIKATVTSYTDGDAKWYFTHLTVTPGQTYLFSDYYIANIPSQVIVEIIKNDGTYDYLNLKIAEVATTWTKYTDTFTVPVGASTLTVLHLITAIGFLTTDDYSLTPYQTTSFNRPLLSLTFDDGWEDNYSTALPILNQCGFKSTQFYATTFIVNNQAEADLKIPEFVNSGHEIGSHSVTHPDLRTLTIQQLDQELIDSQKTLEKYTGIGNVQSFATPFGSYDARVLTEIMKYYNSQRSTDTGYNTEDSLYVGNIKVQNMFNTTTLDEYTSWINQAIAEKAWLVILYHRVASTNIGQYDTPLANFAPQMEIIKNSGINVLTIKDALTELIPQLPIQQS